MALSTATITFDLADLLGVDFDARRTKVWVSTNIPDETVIDTAGNQIRLGSGKAAIDTNGTGSFTVWVPGTGSNPASWQTYVHVDYVDAGDHRKGRQTRTFGPFTITVNADLADLVQQAVTPPAILGGDAYMATVDADGSSQFRQQQDARVAATYVRVTEAPLNARRYGAVNDGVTNDAAAYQAAVNALPGDINAGGGSILIDGQTVWNAPIEVINKAGVKFESPGGFQSYISPGAAIAGTGKPLLTVKGTAAVVRGFQMENVNIDMLGVDAHAIEVAGAFDNTELSNVWVRGVHRSKSAFRFIPGPTADGISQSIILDNVQGIRIDATLGTGAACTAPMFLLDRVHEAVLRLTKAISTGQSVGGVGYHLRDCEQVTLDLPSASNLQDSFSITSTGGGLLSQAITIRDPYLETVQRGAVVAGASEAEPVFKVRLLHPRISNPSTPPVVFHGTYARLCDLSIYDEPVSLLAGAYMNRIECAVDAVTDSSGSGQNTIVTHPNGLGEGLDYNNRLRVDGNGTALGVDQTGLLIMFSPYGGTPVWRRVKMGAEGSGGTGFRALIVPN